MRLKKQYKILRNAAQGKVIGHLDYMKGEPDIRTLRSGIRFSLYHAVLLPRRQKDDFYDYN